MLLQPYAVQCTPFPMIRVTKSATAASYILNTLNTQAFQHFHFVSVMFQIYDFKEQQIHPHTPSPGLPNDLHVCHILYVTVQLTHSMHWF